MCYNRTMDAAKFNKLPKSVKEFINAARESARRVPEWRGDDDFIDSLLYIKVMGDGSVEVSDNYERFFDTIYTFRPDGSVELRWGYADHEAVRDYALEKALSDASILFSG